MRGILSSAPSLGSVRLLLGGKLLLLVQSWLVLSANIVLQRTAWFVAGAIVVIAILCLIGAVIGEPAKAAVDHERAWQRSAKGRDHE